MRISKSTILKAATAFIVAALVSTGTVPSIVSEPKQAHAQTNWTVFDNPIYGPAQSWFGGTPNGRHGYTHSENAGRYYKNSNYIYTNSSRGEGAYADWKLSSGSLEGRYEIQAYIPSNKSHAAAKATYEVLECKRRAAGQLTCSIEETFPQVTQAGSSGWIKLGEYEFTHKSDVIDNRLTLRYAIVDPYRGNSHVSVDAVRMRRVSGSGNSGDTDTTDTSPPAQIVRPIALVGDRSITVGWWAPSSGSSIVGYDIEYWIRHNDGSRSGLKSIRLDTTASWNSKVVSGLTNGRSYQFQVRAENRHGTGIWSRPVVGIPQAKEQVQASPKYGYLQDRPVTRGSEWKHHDEGIGNPPFWSILWSKPFEAMFNGLQRLIDSIPGLDRYAIKTEDRYSHDIQPRDSISTIRSKQGRIDSQYGANGYEVIHYERNHQRDTHWAYWKFDDVPAGRYNVEVFVPDPKDRDKRPGSIVNYIVQSDEARAQVSTKINQSWLRYRGEWASIKSIELVREGDVWVNIYGSYNNPYGPNSWPSSRSGGVPGEPEWRNNIAVDAARLTPVEVQQCDTLGYSHECWNYGPSDRGPIVDAWVRCVVDIFAMTYWSALSDAIDQFWGDHIRKALIEELVVWLITLALSGALTAFSAGTATPAVVAAITAKIAHSATRIAQLLRQVRRISPWVDDVIEKTRQIAGQLNDIKGVGDNLLAAFDLLLTGLDIVTDGGQRAREISRFCEEESVWENYYGYDNW